MAALPVAALLRMQLFSFLTGNLTRSTIALFGFITLVTVSCGAYDYVSILKEKSATLAIEDQQEKNEASLLDLTWRQQQVKIDVIQVQQSLVVYAAARAQEYATC